MSSELYKSKLKLYHIILLGCLLGSILVLNSHLVNEEKIRLKQNKKEEAFFNKIISKRLLQENSLTAKGNDDGEELFTEAEIVCSRSSKELQEYYNTSDLSKIDLDEGGIKCEDKDEDYIKALIQIVQSLIDGDGEEENDDENNHIINENANVKGNLRNLLDSETEENIKTYGMRIFPLLVFAVFSILSFFGWIICCFCNCCNCCCCCCCKKAGCKIPCLIFTYFFYICVIAVCIYGVTQTNKIFTGLSNTECSFMQFFDQILTGEPKETKPKWIGIEGVSNILNNLHKQIKEMSEAHLEEELDIYMDDITEQRDNFLPRLKTVHKNFYEDDEATIPKEGYYIEYDSSDNKFIEVDSQRVNLVGKYVLDLVTLFGKYDEEKNEFTGLNAIWNYEIAEIDEKAGSALEEARDSFVSMLGENLGKIEDGLSMGSEKLDKLRKPFNNVYDKISGVLYDASEYSDKYGELAVKLVFYTLAIMNIILAVFMLLICYCSTESFVSFSCCRCFCKFFIHLIWNILALFMIIAFLVGSLIALIGRIGGDMMSLVSFVMSEDNFNSPNPVLLNKLGAGKDILKECVAGEGNLSKVFELDDITGDFDTINQVKDEIREYKKNFSDLAQSYPAYYHLKSWLENRTEFIDDTNFVNENAADGDSPVIKLSEIMKLLNNSIGNTNDEKWNPYTGDNNFICTEEDTGSGPTGSPKNKLIHPWFCEPIYRGWIISSSDIKIKNYATIASDAIEILKYASRNKTPEYPDYESYYDILDQLKIDYKDYLETFIHVLEFFETITMDIINALDEGIGGNGDTFSFLNGKFIKTNLKIVLKYLKYSLGQDIYTVGICLVFVGFSLIFSISATILLIVIINVDLEKHEKYTKRGTDFEYPNNDGRIVQFKY